MLLPNTNHSVHAAGDEQFFLLTSSNDHISNCLRMNRTHFTVAYGRGDISFLLHTLAHSSFCLIHIFHAALVDTTHCVGRNRVLKTPETNTTITTCSQQVTRIIYESYLTSSLTR